MPRDEFLAWLAAAPSDEPWGDLAGNEDVAEYVHERRRQPAILTE
jgi:hypothetical protein